MIRLRYFLIAAALTIAAGTASAQDDKPMESHSGKEHRIRPMATTKKGARTTQLTTESTTTGKQLGDGSVHTPKTGTGVRTDSKSTGHATTGTNNPKGVSPDYTRHKKGSGAVTTEDLKTKSHKSWGSKKR